MPFSAACYEGSYCSDKHTMVASDQASQSMFESAAVLCPLLLKPMNNLTGNDPSFALENREELRSCFCPRRSSVKMLFHF